MKSNTNTMFNYIKKQKGDFVVPIEINTDNFLAYTLEQYLYKKNRFKKVIKEVEAIKLARYNSIILEPYFAMEVEKWSKNIGVKVDFWSQKERDKFEDYFINKYRDMMK
jgi:hypothetical protein